MEKHESLWQEVTALDKRGEKIGNSGYYLFWAGAGTFVLAGISFALSRFLGPHVQDFVINVPAALIPDLTESNGGGGLEITTLFDAVSGFVPVIATIAIVFAIFGSVLKFFQGEGLGGVLPMFGIIPLIGAMYLFTGIVGDDSSSHSGSEDTPKKIIHEFIKNDEPGELVAWLHKNALNTADPILLDYVTAQASIKQNKPDVKTIRKVVSYYNGLPRARTEVDKAKMFDGAPEMKTVPDDTRYALEVTGFNKTVSAQASRYETRKLKKARLFSGLSSGGFTLGGILALLGAALILVGFVIKRRVEVIKEIAFK